MNRRTLVIAAGGLLLALPAAAQDSAELIPFTPVQGSINGAPVTYRFSARTGEPFSFRVETTAGNLDPVLTITDSAGATLIANDDYNYPETSGALLEAITIPTFGSYTATVSGFGDTSGDYLLTMLPGYAAVGGQEKFDAIGAWAAPEDEGTVELGDGTLRLSLAGVQERMTAFDGSMSPFEDFFAQVRVPSISGTGWNLGMVGRAQDNGDAYVFLVNERGEWRALLQTADGDQIVRDWTRHPAIRFDQGPFTLGLMAVDTSFEFFFNGNILGGVTSSAPGRSGMIGLTLGKDRLAGDVSAEFDDLELTVPFEIDGKPIIPQQLILLPGNGMMQDLQRRRVVPGGGLMVLNLAESSTQYNRAGVNILPLASGMTFTNMVMGTTVRASSVNGPPGGCGLILRSTAADNYALAYIDGHGGYGLSERDGDMFSPGLFGERANWLPSVEHHLLVIAVGDTLRYYVDGEYAGAMDSAERAGGIGEAVVNFEPATTTCRYMNTWLWRW